MRIVDSLGSAFASVAAMFGRGGEGRAPLDLAYTAEAGILAYLSSGMLRKTIRIPASDRTSKWRDWQADGDAIGKIEDEETRLGLRQKVKQAEILRGLGGGALILIVAGENHDQPLNPASVRPGGLVAVNVVSRWQITGLDWDQNLASPTYGEPRMWQVSGSGQQQKIHPSRVVTFRGDPLTVGYGVGSHEQAYWGDCRLQAVLREVLRSDDAQAWFAALVRKAKLLRVGIPDLLDMMASPEGKQQLNERMRLIAEGESVLNAVVYRSGTGADDPGEKIDDYQITWAGIPAVMDAFDQRVAAVADIPFTRLMGRSPAGMNSTGSHDEANYWTSISSDQENDLRPCLRAIDPFLLASAGVPEAGVTWTFAPLSTPSEQDRATTIKTMTDALKTLHDMAVMPEEAFNEAAQNLLIEDGVLPGLDQILAKFSDDERYGIVGTMDPSLGDPSALSDPQAVKGGDPVSPTARGAGGSGAPARAANDKADEE